jgi:hypothetical protein
MERVLHRSDLRGSFFFLILWIQTLVGNVCEFVCKILLWSCDLIMGDLDVIVSIMTSTQCPEEERGGELCHLDRLFRNKDQGLIKGHLDRAT